MWGSSEGQKTANHESVTRPDNDQADFPAVFFHISHWYLSWNTTDKSKSQESIKQGNQLAATMRKLEVNGGSWRLYTRKLEVVWSHTTSDLLVYKEVGCYLTRCTSIVASIALNETHESVVHLYALAAKMWGSGRVQVEKYPIGYFQVCRIFPGIIGYLRVYQVIPNILGFPIPDDF